MFGLINNPADKYNFRNEKCPTCHDYPVMNGNLRKVNPELKN